MVLQNYIHDFHSLVEWFRLKWEYEHTDPPQRPNFLAWEIRGASPRKVSFQVIINILLFIHLMLTTTSCD